jgi:glycosyltransferase involved in cell wall biosynthesis
VDFLPAQHRQRLCARPPKTSFLQRLPFANRLYKYFLPLMPLAIEQFDLSGYDIVISNSHAVAKGVITGPDQLHICYCYTPMRYAWDLQHQYLEEAGISHGLRGAIARWFLHRLRIWDTRTASGVDHFIACSGYIARRIKKAYRRTSTVIYPNVAVADFKIGTLKSDFYVTASRMVPYKKMRLIVEAFARMPDRNLVVIGTGPQFEDAKAIATPNVIMLGYQPFEVLLKNLQEAKAFIFASEEDFGIAPVEAQACGTPVLAFGRGGACETVIDGITGLHFHEQSPEAICDAVERFERRTHGFDPTSLRAHAEQFSTTAFRRTFRQFVESKWAEHKSHAPSHRPRAVETMEVVA